MAEEFKHLVRICNADLKGNKPLAVALMNIKGVSHSFASAVAIIAGIDKNKKAGVLTEKEMEKIEEILKNPAKFKIPPWMLNRRKDYETGEDKHLVTVELAFEKENDIKRMKKIKSYKGIRHGKGLPVRGQRTKGHFRKGRALGVARKKGARSGRV